MEPNSSNADPIAGRAEPRLVSRFVAWAVTLEAAHPDWSFVAITRRAYELAERFSRRDWLDCACCFRLSFPRGATGCAE